MKDPSGTKWRLIVPLALAFLYLSFPAEISQAIEPEKICEEYPAFVGKIKQCPKEEPPVFSGDDEVRVWLDRFCEDEQGADRIWRDDKKSCGRTPKAEEAWRKFEEEQRQLEKLCREKPESCAGGM